MPKFDEATIEQPKQPQPKPRDKVATARSWLRVAADRAAHRSRPQRVRPAGNVRQEAL